MTTRLHTIPVQDATGQTAELFGAIRKAIGKVPNAYATIGSNAPAVLANALQTGQILKNGALSARELEAINLAVSEHTGCDYCVAAHTLMGKLAGYSGQQMRQLREGSYPDDVKIDALVRFVLELVSTRGTVPAESVQAVRAAGYTDGQIVEIIQAMSAILFTNMVNRVNDTALDFPAVA
ncbi:MULTISPECIES: carboxymuconolactone decarboxylase family protein [Cupriavidus]|uniref:Alkylhydroperoxidase AhpD core n=1 Tax=Cupriavidus pinatubonensis (strain JMP 134 / LMG 1197) TaxID=264198 RepID=Q46N38_CUPPJ|nr:MULTISPECIES: carboxymuconolactone decarboxylase family protein [Cupriavidus]QYY34082.1 carboxymuconolactone decarboxylase family protein [Cupriavidus pinatubonensis]TPQ28565.1 alkylhydroperoxidase [Cupriavidus pinatubonensis]